jgi:hypothetical protein
VPAALLAHDRQDRAGDVQGSEEIGLHLRPELRVADLLEIAGIEVAGIVHEDVDAAEAIDGGLGGGRCGVRIGDVQRDGQEVVMLPDRLQHPVRVASGRDDEMPRRQCLLGDIDAQTPARASDEPYFLVSHRICFLFLSNCRPRRDGRRLDARRS